MSNGTRKCARQADRQYRVYLKLGVNCRHPVLDGQKNQSSFHERVHDFVMSTITDLMEQQLSQVQTDQEVADSCMSSELLLSIVRRLIEQFRNQCEDILASEQIPDSNEVRMRYSPHRSSNGSSSSKK